MGVPRWLSLPADCNAHLAGLSGRGQALMAGKAYKHNKRGAGRFVQLPEWIMVTEAWATLPVGPRALRRIEAALQWREQWRHITKSSRRCNLAARTPQHSWLVVQSAGRTWVHLHDARAPSWSVRYRPRIDLGAGRSPDDGRGKGSINIQEIQNPRINTVHTLSHILCVVLRWARSCTRYVTLGARLATGSVTVTRTYIHLAIGSAFKQGAHIAAEPLPGGVQNLPAHAFVTGIRSKLHASTNQGFQGNEAAKQEGQKYYSLAHLLAAAQ